MFFDKKRIFFLRLINGFCKCKNQLHFNHKSDNNKLNFTPTFAN